METASKRHWLPISAILVFVSIVYLIFLTSVPFKSLSPSSLATASKYHSFHAPKQNVWVDLSTAEADELFAFLYDSSNDLNLTRNPELTDWENAVRLVQVLQPNKSDVVQYIDESGSPPLRWAHIILNERATPQTRVAEYMVGHLGSGESISAVPLTYCYNSGRNHINTAVGDTDALLFGLAAAANISDITMDLLGAKMDPN